MICNIYDTYDIYDIYRYIYMCVFLISLQDIVSAHQNGRRLSIVFKQLNLQQNDVISDEENSLN